VPLTAFLVSAAAFLSAFLGGVVALRAVSRVGMIIAVGAGIRIGAAFFDLIPEAADLLGGSLDHVMFATAFGFLAFYAIEKLTAVHVGHEAAAELDLTGAAVVVFRHAGHGRVNLVYRRADGHIGWVDPPPFAPGDAIDGPKTASYGPPS